MEYNSNKYYKYNELHNLWHASKRPQSRPLADGYVIENHNVLWLHCRDPVMT